MNTIGPWAAFILALCSCTSDTLGQGTLVAKVRGNASYSQTETKWNRVRAGSRVPTGAVIKTEVDSALKLVLGDNNLELILFPESTLRCSHVNGAPRDNTSERVVNLTAGTLTCSILSSTAAPPWNITTPNVSISLPANVKSQLQINVMGVVHVIEGSITAVYANPVTQKKTDFTLSAGESLITPVLGNSNTKPNIRRTHADEILRDPLASSPGPGV